MFNRDFLSVIESVGIPLELIDFRATYDYLNPKIWNRVNEFEIKLSQIGSNIKVSNFDEMVAQKLFQEIEKLMLQYKDIFDKELYVLHMSTLLINDVYNENVHKNNGREVHEVCDEYGNRRESTENDLAISRLVRDWNKINSAKGKTRFVRTFYSMVNSERPFTDKENSLNKALDFMRKAEFETYDTFGSTLENIVVLPSLIECGKKDVFNEKLKQNKNKFREINKFLGIEEVLKYLPPEDLINVSINKYVGNAIYQVINSKLKSTEFEKDSDREELYLKMFMENVQYINPDKLIVLSLYNYYNKYGNDLKRFTSEELDELKFRVNAMDRLLGKNDVKITPINYTDKNETTISYKDLKSKILELDKRFINGQYRDETEVGDLRVELIKGTRGFNGFSAEDIRDKIGFSNIELALCFEQNPILIKRFVEEGILQINSEEERENDSSSQRNDLENKILDILHKQSNIPYEEFRYLLENKLLDLDNFIDLYMKNKIDLRDIERLKNDPIEHISLDNAVSSSKLMDLYSYDEISDDFIRYRELYKIIKVNGKTVEERSEVANSIISSYEEKNDDLLEDKMVYDLYKMGLLPILSVIEYVGDSALTDMIKAGKCKPEDIRQLYYSGTISRDTLTNIMANDEIDNNEKLALIYGAFSEPNERDIREDLISSSFNTTEESVHNPSGKTGEKTMRPFSQYYRRFKTDPALRWNFIKNLDSDFSQQLLKDGSIIFYLPNRNEYWIEKIFDLKNENGYGNATYILEEPVYRQHEKEIILKGKINRSFLGQLNRNNPRAVKRQIHSENWGERIISLATNNGRYTEEEIGRLNEIAVQIRDSRQEIEQQ